MVFMIFVIILHSTFDIHYTRPHCESSSWYCTHIIYITNSTKWGGVKWFQYQSEIYT